MVSVLKGSKRAGWLGKPAAGHAANGSQHLQLSFVALGLVRGITIVKVISMIEVQTISFGKKVLPKRDSYFSYFEYFREIGSESVKKSSELWKFENTSILIGDLVTIV